MPSYYTFIVVLWVISVPLPRHATFHGIQLLHFIQSSISLSFQISSLSIRTSNAFHLAFIAVAFLFVLPFITAFIKMRFSYHSMTQFISSSISQLIFTNMLALLKKHFILLHLLCVCLNFSFFIQKHL